MIQKLKRRQAGFTLIELLIVVAIIGIIAAILIPNLIDALQKAKQKRSVADMRNTGTAMMALVTDQLSAAAAGQSSKWQWVPGGETTFSTVEAELKPSTTFFYMAEVPQIDGWKNDYDLFIDAPWMNRARWAIGIRSPGRDGSFEGSEYSVGPFTATDYDKDIVWGDGYFIAWPGGVK